MEMLEKPPTKLASSCRIYFLHRHNEKSLKQLITKLIFLLNMSLFGEPGMKVEKEIAKAYTITEGPA